VADGASLTVRPLVAADRDWARRYWRERWGSERLVLRDTLFDITSFEGFVVERAGQPVGVVTYRVTGGECEIMTLDAIDQGRGTGTALVDRVKAEAVHQGCRRLTVSTTNDNLDALRFYQRRGFRLETVDPGAVDRGRRLKPEIPLVGMHEIPIRDEIRLGMALDSGDGQSE
jgi:GNAT superfamily N-acetyltransferase